MINKSFFNRKINLFSGKSIKEFFSFNLHYSFSVFLLVSVQRLMIYPFLANKMGAEDFGTFILFMTIVNSAIVIIPGCINMTVIKIHADYDEDNKKVLMSSGILLVIISSIIVSFLTYTIFPTLTNLLKITDIYKVFMLPLVFYIVIYSFRKTLIIKQRINLKFKQISLYNIFFSLFFILLIPVFYITGLKGIFWGFVFAGILSTIPILIKNYSLLIPTNLNYSFKEYFKYSPSFAFVSIVELSLLASSRYIISYYKDPKQVAYFFAAVSIIQILVFPFMQIRTILLSLISQKKHISDFSIRNVKIVILSTLLVGLILFIFGLFIGKIIIIKLYSIEYYQNARLALFILLIGQIFYLLKSYLNNFIVVFYSRRILNYNYLITLAINILINFIFVPKFGIEASAFAFSISLFVSSLLWCIILFKERNEKGNSSVNSS